ncbi:hypothetical protein BBO99_00007240 [Phytophthora kernoviae]|uniref:Uncharacterized protein n=2 Tax=Phytophthora kernoviae TaxID=325452 RepID=A0A3R7HFH1_9STRA|nr:hypothetical protein G195_009215 [Phytophthora kernoviae 00238/432]KAG2515804.1 hypothetical protein JM16_006797 [Phytophthora kernoviae]KAG2519235.1 hypothetical protein JM18_006676 [Phytophthora kernoviae]RLN10719.1 hypothetical protein BBI17_007203 [Phytophthora kernoviae]RLN76820.1 hypothetical protein BBO99_00007240 [Phytophthora kernoviae]
MLRTAEKEFDTADASTKQHPTKAYWDHPSKQHGSSDAAPINNAAWDSSNQDIHFTQPGELHPEDIHSALDAQTGIGAAYDPLSLMMTSIYF